MSQATTVNSINTSDLPRDISQLYMQINTNYDMIYDAHKFNTHSKADRGQLSLTRLN